MSSSEVQLAPLIKVGEVIVFSYGITFREYSADFFLYGIYTIVFVLSIHVLYRQKASVAKAHQLYKSFAIALYLLTTIWMVFTTWYKFQDAIIEFNAASSQDFSPLYKYLTSDTQKTVSMGFIDITSSLINLTAELMLIHRCYVIWSSSKLLLYSLLVASIILNGLILLSIGKKLGFAKSLWTGIDLGSNICITIALSNEASDSSWPIYLKGSMINNGNSIALIVFNVILTLMTAGWIWWITRQARQVMGISTQMRYKIIVSIIKAKKTSIESGALFAGTAFIYLIIQLTVDSTASTTAVPIDLFDIATLVSALAPTLIIVRAAYGKTIESVNEVVSTLQFNAAEGPERSVGRATVHSVHADQAVEESLEGQAKKETI